MPQSAQKIGNVFTKYSLVIILAIVVVGIVLFLAGDFVYSQIRPDQPTIKYPIPDTTVSKNPPTFEGEMPVSSAIEIYVDGKKIATRKPENQTVWNFTPETQLTIGTHTLSVTAISEQGIKSKPTPEVSFSVPKRPQITSYYDGQIFVGESPTFEGEAAANTEVDLYIDDVFIVSGRTDADGKWRFAQVPPIVVGKHVAKVVAVKTLGEFKNASEPLSFSIQKALQ